MEDSETKISSPWIECESKKNPGRKYLFNKSTGESKWLSPTKDKTLSSPTIEVKNTSANERLKRLQRNLQKPRTLDQKTKEAMQKTDTSQKNDALKPTKQQKPSTSTSPNKQFKKSALSPRKRSREKVENVDEVALNAILEKKPRKDPMQNQDIVKNNKVPKTGVSSLPELKKHKEVKKISNEDKQKSLNKNSININKRFKIPKKVEKTKNIFAKLLGTEKVKEQKEETKDTVFKKKPTQKAETAIVLTSSEHETASSTKSILITSSDDEISTPKKSIVITTAENYITTPKIPFEVISSKDEISSPKKLCVEEQMVKPNTETKNENTQKSEKGLQTTSTEFNIKEDITTVSSASRLNFPSIKFLTNCISTPITHLRRKANDRLTRLRQNLEKENITKSISLDQNSNTLTTSSNTTDCEEMDWEESIESPSTCSFNSSISQNNSANEQVEMEIDENLMLSAAEKITDPLQTNKEKWLKDHLYIVLDTNIFIHHLDFIEKLKIYKPAGTNGIILYLPYSVLQELDKLKVRGKIQSEVIRAIKYLNKVFETKDSHVQAQNALENINRLIEVESCDDNILNACLQVREHITNLILFTEDVNLRNKAMCNSIKVATKHDFLNGVGASQKWFST